MVRAFYLAYAALCYTIFFATVLYLIAFVGNLPVPRTVDRGPATSLGEALVIDVLLLGLFAVQHSVEGYCRHLARAAGVVSPELAFLELRRAYARPFQNPAPPAETGGAKR